MQNFLEKIIVAVESLQERSLNERRALFFASFIVLGTVVFAFWSNHMYRQFGVAFFGGYGRPTELVQQRDTKGGLLSPFDAVYENARLIKTEAGNLFSEVSDRVKELSGFVTVPTREEAGKEPPVLLGEAAEEKPAPVAVKVENKPRVEVPAKKESATVGATKPVVAKSEVKTPELAKPMPITKEQKKETIIPTAKGEKRSRIASILATNFASIKQAFADFYEYLTR